jgi:hypothetical protein
LLAVLLTCGVVCLPATRSALAQAPADDPAKKPETLKPIDEDGDGKVTRVEWSKFTQSFIRLDANKDAAVDLAELQAAGQTTDTPLILAPADANRDGKLTRPEWSAMVKSFKQLDGNGDGSFDLAELQAAAKYVAEATKDGGRPPIIGMWRGWIVDGRGENPNRGTMQIELSITPDRIAGREVGPRGDSPPDLGIGAYSLTGNAKQGFLDARYLTGPQTGQTCLGVFRFEDDVFYWCCSNRGNRPNDFITSGGWWLMILRRVPQNPAN